MAEGLEVMLGWKGEHAIRDAVKQLGLEFDELDGDGDPEKDYTDYANLLKTEKYDELLFDAHAQLLYDFGFEKVEKSEDQFRKVRLIAQTPEGEREFDPLHMATRGFVEDYTLHEGVVLGVPLSGRYWPTLLDWRNRSGTLWTVSFDRDMQRDIDKARRAITKAIPLFDGAVVHVVFETY
jgi:hypothetical protein